MATPSSLAMLNSEQLAKLLQGYTALKLHQVAASQARQSSSLLSPTCPSRYLSVEQTSGDSTWDRLLSLSNTRSLHGPLLPTLNTTTPTTLPFPVLTPHDTRLGEHGYTTLEGQDIYYFTIGGEKRLCMLQLITTVLREIDVPEINRIAAALHIHCSPCTQIQLDILKLYNVLPVNATNCSLITKTDAQRLCIELSKRARPPVSAPSNPPRPSGNGMLVYHDCFGRCSGVYDPDMYTAPRAQCIECVECSERFCPERFVTHSHRDHEQRTCHWGFDAENWRWYIHERVPKEGVVDLEAEKQRCRNVLEEMKERFAKRSKTSVEVTPEKPTSSQALSADLAQQVTLKRKLLEVGLDTSLDPKRLRLSLDSVRARQSAGLAGAPGSLTYDSLIAQLQQRRLAATQGDLCVPTPVKVAPLPATARLQSTLPTVPVKSKHFCTSEYGSTLGTAKGSADAERLSAGECTKTVDDVDVTTVTAPTPPATYESLGPKKSLLQRSEILEHNKHDQPSLPSAADETQRSASESTTSVPVEGGARSPQSFDSDLSSPVHTRNPELMTLDRLLSHYVSDSTGLSMIRKRIAESQRGLENRIDHLAMENRHLQLENKQIQQELIRLKQNDLLRLANLTTLLQGQGGAAKMGQLDLSALANGAGLYV